MVTDEQVKRLRKLLAKGAELFRAAERTKMSEGTARKWRSGRLPSEGEGSRTWRTRPNPFKADWPWVTGELKDAPELEARTLFDELQRQHPERYQEGQLRTLQRHIRFWRATEGPGKEVMFRQEIEPGKQAQSDFTSMNEVGVTIAGEPFPHLLYHLQLPYSNWEYAEIAFSESFEALSQGFQNGVWTLGAVAPEHRTDNTTAATHDLRSEEGRDFNERYRSLMAHYGVTPTTNNVGRGHENGDVEQSHNQLKRQVVQALLLRGSREFASRADYEAFLEQLIARSNRGRSVRLAEELPKLDALPKTKLDAWKEVTARVGEGSTIQAGRNTYSVPSQLIGHEVQVRIHADLLEVRVGQTVVDRFERLRGQGGHRVNYRHVIHSLVQKPGAFKNYRYRDDLYPSVVFRRAYDALAARFGERGGHEYVRVLHLAATTSERDVAAAIELVLEAGGVPELSAVRELVVSRVPAIPPVRVRVPSLADYDALLERRAVPA